MINFSILISPSDAYTTHVTAERNAENRHVFVEAIGARVPPTSAIDASIQITMSPRPVFRPFS